ncbi:Concanavalin A-like lectin/glucanase, subgroup [Artemisia annua]|uniref:Concanavalin A-like lectin/glucanase, subgroup n=1 Tax=Artemisia annua TaxID=35608 RepID=A0A2U1PS39_ARTAN|nr:Concanavalin A-like lectin/glucanase, subgroup [Artemisia annua]
MGYISCNAESAISTCDTYNFSKKNPKTNPQHKHYKIRDFTYTDLESSTNKFSHTNFLGKGSHGSVYKANLDKCNDCLIAAVKKTTSLSAVSPADNEIEILSRVRSPRFVNLLGFASDPIGRKLIVVEYMPNGSLYDLLHKSNNSFAKPPGLAKRIKIALQVAKAVNQLHVSSPPVIHRDIKSSNILFDHKWRARLGDFGLALRGHVENDAKMRCTPPAGTLGYLDPCYLAPCDLTVKSDVFSFGILMLEIFSGRHAIDLRFSPPSVVDWAVPLIRSGEYHEVFDRGINISRGSEAVLRQLAVLAAMCVKPTAEKRPKMTEVVESLVKVTKTGWRVIKVTRQPVTEYMKLSNVPRVESSDGSSGGGEKISGHVARSKSIGGVSDVECGPLDEKKEVQGLCGIMRRSKSTGELLVNRRNSGGIVLQMIRNPNVRELESAKLLVKFS